MSTVNDARPLGIAGLVDPVEVGRGGFGVVYAATETETGRTVAVKILSAVADHRQQARFEAECRAMQTLSHLPYIARIDRWGRTDDDRPYLVMEYLPGGSLAERLRVGGPLLPERVRILGEQIAMALSAAHRVGIIHRDVKPENILLDADGQAKLTDFGIAVVTGMTAGTTTGTLVASFAHVAPELLDGARPSPLVDVYSLGSTLITLLTGEPPFQVEGESPSQMLARVLQGSIPDLRPHGVPDDLDGIIRRAMARDPAHRTPSAEQLGAELRGSVVPSTARGSAAPARAVPAPSAPPAKRRGRLVLAGALGLLTLIAVVIGIALLHGSGATPTAHSTSTTVTIPPVAEGTSLVDLRSVDWKNRTYPGTCADDPGKPHNADVRSGTALANGMNVTVSAPVYGDMSGDGRAEAVVQMDCVSATGGNQAWSRAYVFAPGSSGPVYAGELADTIGGIGADTGTGNTGSVQKLTVDNGTLTVTASAYSADAPHCCPDMTVVTGWKIEGGKLTRASRQASYTGTPSTQPTDPQPTISTAPTPTGFCYDNGAQDCDAQLRADAGTVNIRSEASTTAQSVGTATGGQTVNGICVTTGQYVPTATSQPDQWVKIDLGSGNDGWIYASAFTSTTQLAFCE